jgi:hypothetical protein
VYFSFTTKINILNRNRNVQYWWEVSGKYESRLDLSKDTLSVWNSYNSYNENFKKIAEGKWRRKLLDV